jgi:hypothetical protein
MKQRQIGFSINFNYMRWTGPVPRYRDSYMILADFPARWL